MSLSVIWAQAFILLYRSIPFPQAWNTVVNGADLGTPTYVLSCRHSSPTLPAQPFRRSQSLTLRDTTFDANVVFYRTAALGARNWPLRTLEALHSSHSSLTPVSSFRPCSTLSYSLRYAITSQQPTRACGALRVATFISAIQYGGCGMTSLTCPKVRSFVCKSSRAAYPT